MELKTSYLCPPGYKQTEVGVIPDDWQVETINQLLEDKSILGHLDGNHGELYPKSSEFKQHGVPYIGANDFAEGFVTFERCKFLSKERAAQFRKGVAKDGDVLFAHNATVGPVALLRTSEPTIILSTTATYFRCNEEKLSNIYLKSALHSPHFVKQYQAVMAQSTRFQVPITAQRKLSLVIPPLSEQRTIAGALSDVDELIGSLDQLIAKKRDLKQAAMQQLLTGLTRLPGFHAEWEVKRFADVAFPRRDRVDPRSTGVHEFCIELEHIESASGVLLGSTSTGDQSSLKSVFRTGDVLFGKLRAYLRKYWLATCSGVCSTEIWVFVPNDRLITTDYLFQLVKTDLFIEAASNAYGTHMPRSDWNVVKNYEVQLPPLPEQTAIAEVLSDMDAGLAALQQRRGKTRALKQGMMQELLTGRTRLV